VRIRFAVAPGAGWQEPPLLGPFVDALERLRFDTAWLSDLPIGAPVDPVLGLTFAAARTTRLKLGANVVPLGRNPFRFAKELAQLDRLSDGRLLLSFVPGIGTVEERQMLGFATADRGEYLERVIPAFRRWWAGEAAAYPDDGFDVPALVLEPVPVQQPLEIWLGGRGPRALERVGRFADGWLGGLATPAIAGAARRTIEAAAERAGRVIDPDHFGVGVSYARADPPADVVAGVLARVPRGTAVADVLPIGRDALRQRIDEHVAEGISKFVVRPVGPTESPDEELGWLADALLPLQT
jgi:probable F420-dependent oxidoreductase